MRRAWMSSNRLAAIASNRAGRAGSASGGTGASATAASWARTCWSRRSCGAAPSGGVTAVILPYGRRPVADGPLRLGVDLQHPALPDEGEGRDLGDDPAVGVVVGQPGRRRPWCV